MEFCEKLQELRKSKGLTQEELAEALYVSRTAVSKWESGRGYPSIDSLKEISAYFGVSIDHLLSGEKLISIAEKERKSHIQAMCDMLLGVTDLFSLLLMVLPLYPRTVNGYVYSVSLFAYTETSALNRGVYWGMFLLMMGMGIWKLLLMCRKAGKIKEIVTDGSMGLSVLAVLFLALAGETYAVALTFLLLVIKAALLFHCAKAGGRKGADENRG